MTVDPSRRADVEFCESFGSAAPLAEALVIAFSDAIAGGDFDEELSKHFETDTTDSVTISISDQFDVTLILGVKPAALGEQILPVPLVLYEIVERADPE